MEIYKKDYITIDLVESGNREGNNVGGPMYGLVFTIQCNGKIKRHTTNFAVDLDKNGLKIVKQWQGIHAVIELLDDLGYPMDVNNMQDIIDTSLRCTDKTEKTD